MYMTARKVTLGLSLAAFMLAGVARADDNANLNQADLNAKSDQHLTQAQKDLHAGKFSVRRLSDLYNKNFYNANDKDVGNLKDVIVCPQTSQLVFGIVHFENSVGFGDKDFAIPWMAFNTKINDKDYNEITYSMDVDNNKSQLQELQGFDKNNWPNLADSSYSRKLFSVWGQQPYWEMNLLRSGPGASITGTPISPDSNHQDLNKQLRSHVLVKGRDLVGHDLLDQDGAKIGVVKDVMADPKSGALVYLLTKANKAQGLGDNVYPVPFSLLMVREKGAKPVDENMRNERMSDEQADLNREIKGKMLTDAGQFEVIFNSSIDKLKSGPNFSDLKWPIMTPEWGESVYNHYGVRPFWKADMSGTHEGHAEPSGTGTNR